MGEPPSYPRRRLVYAARLKSLTLRRQPTGFVFAHPGTFRVQTLEFVGAECLAQQRLHPSMRAHFIGLAYGFFRNMRRIDESGETRGFCEFARQAACRAR